MRILFVDTYYPNFLLTCYQKKVGLCSQNYASQHRYLINQLFGTSDSYSRYLNEMGHEAVDVIANCFPLQKTWAKENDITLNNFSLDVYEWLSKNHLTGRIIKGYNGLSKIAIEQIKCNRPDVLYCQDLWFLSPSDLKEIRQYVKLIVGQTASPLPNESCLKFYDLILTSFPHFVPRIQSLGIPAAYFRIGFDEKIIEFIGHVDKDIDVSFVGGLSRHHRNALMLLEHLANNTNINIFGYGVNSLNKSSPIISKHCGEVWGLEMYRALARSKITLNRHIKVAENFANNMRLYEATGVGTLLITDEKDNLEEIFEIGKEIVVYRSKDEAVDLIRYYLNHPDEASKIAKAGQMRTLKDHTYKNRMSELILILEKYIRA